MEQKYLNLLEQMCTIPNMEKPLLEAFVTIYGNDKSLMEGLKEWIQSKGSDFAKNITGKELTDLATKATADYQKDNIPTGSDDYFSRLNQNQAVVSQGRKALSVLNSAGKGIDKKTGIVTSHVGFDMGGRAIAMSGANKELGFKSAVIGNVSDPKQMKKFVETKGNNDQRLAMAAVVSPDPTKWPVHDLTYRLYFDTKWVPVMTDRSQGQANLIPVSKTIEGLRQLKEGGHSGMVPGTCDLYRIYLNALYNFGINEDAGYAFAELKNAQRVTVLDAKSSNVLMYVPFVRESMEKNIISIVPRKIAEVIVK
jgi:hypothetical protein